ncbi:unnamed protein product, partial [Cladocopium goreaui]
MALLLSTFLVQQFFWAAAVQFDAYFEEAAVKNNASWAKEESEIQQKLQKLESKFKKKPNIIYILSDDIGFGELGWQGGGKHRGTPGPGLDDMAYQGMRFWSSYSEPSCTPSRVAIMTGRHPVRTGLTTVLWPGQVDGLSPEEVTIAEVLSAKGYHTAMWGKWHMGEEPEHAPENQGFDYAYYGLFNGAPDLWPDGYEMTAVGIPGHCDLKKLEHTVKAALAARQSSVSAALFGRLLDPPVWRCGDSWSGKALGRPSGASKVGAQLEASKVPKSKHERTGAQLEVPKWKWKHRKCPTGEESNSRGIRGMRGAQLEASKAGAQLEASKVPKSTHERTGAQLEVPKWEWKHRRCPTGEESNSRGIRGMRGAQLEASKVGAQLEASKVPKSKHERHERCPTRGMKGGCPARGFKGMKGARLEASKVPNSRHERHERCPARASKVPNSKHQRCPARSMRGAQLEHQRCPTRSIKGAQLEASKVPNSKHERHERCPTRGMRGAQLEASKVPNSKHE